MFVYLPLVGENEGDNEENERARACGPQQRLCRNACQRGRHRFLTLHAGRAGVKSDNRTRALTPSDVPFTLEAVIGTAGALKRISILAFVAPFTLS
ncbi:MAG TPA: hypothetical protein VG868_07385 [Casimicrobiaceae bacterium]|nr:hypothetical protein [Casimicrobiaceae bacterium]